MHSPMRLKAHVTPYQIIDNTGALIAECVNVLKNKTSHGHASIGDTFVCVVQKARPIPQNAAGAPTSGSTLTSLKMKRGDVQRAVLVRSKKAVMRPDGRWVRFDDNAAVLINKKNEMIGTRIGGVVSSDLRRKGWGKIVALAPKV
jgi:ribosomal protein L14